MKPDRAQTSAIPTGDVSGGGVADHPSRAVRDGSFATASGGFEEDPTIGLLDAELVGDTALVDERSEASASDLLMLCGGAVGHDPESPASSAQTSKRSEDGVIWSEHLGVLGSVLAHQLLDGLGQVEVAPSGSEDFLARREAVVVSVAENIDGFGPQPPTRGEGACPTLKRALPIDKGVVQVEQGKAHVVGGGSHGFRRVGTACRLVSPWVLQPSTGWQLRSNAVVAGRAHQSFVAGDPNLGVTIGHALPMRSIHGASSKSSSGPVGRALRWMFVNRRTGRLTVGQWPNVTLSVFVAATIALRVFRPPGGIGSALSVLGDVAITVWAVDEIARGVNLFRRLLGLVVLLVTIASVIESLG